MENSSVILLVVAIAGGLFLLWIILYLIPVGLWFQALVSDVKISLLQLGLMRWRKVPPTVIVSAMIEGKKAGIELYRDLLEAHYLAGGHVAQVVHALVSASKANIDLTFQIATAVDLAGRDVFEAVQMSVNPKVINTPPVTAVAKDGIQLIAKARVTVRANIKRLVGGAGEETVLARVGEGIVSSIGSSESHKAVMENPDFISKVVLDKGLDSGTAIEILKQSLTKKIELLDTIMALNVLQKDMLENPDLDPDELEENLNRKADLVEQLSKLDDGFSQIYDRVRADLTENRGAYSEDIAQMKRDITAIMDKSTAIQSQEKRNQVLMQQKFTSVKKQIKEVKKSRQAVNSYYRNMMKMGTPGSTFLDDKK